MEPQDELRIRAEWEWETTCLLVIGGAALAWGVLFLCFFALVMLRGPG